MRSASSQDWEHVLNQATAWLQAYLRIDTSNPPGDVRLAIAFFQQIFNDAGIESRVFFADESAGKGNLLARLRGSGHAKPLLLLNHMDVVPVEAEQWAVPPFSGEIRDGCVWGRGALDMKAMGMAELAVLLRLKQAGVALNRDLLWLGVCDEEVGGRLGAKWMVEHHYDQLDPEFVIDEGGGGSQGLLTQDARIVFAPSVAEKQPLWLKLIVRGQGGHGSMPEPDSVIEILHRALGRLLAAKESLEAGEDDPVVAVMRERLHPMAHNRFTNAISRHTIAITSVQAGAGHPPQVNVIPSEASALLDCRLLPGASVPEMLSRMKAVLADGRVAVEVLYEPTEVSLVSRHDTQLFRTIERVVREHHPDAVISPQLLTGGTDSRFFRVKGAIAYGFEPLVLRAEELDYIHGHNERIRIEQFHQMIRILYDVVRRVSTDSDEP